MEYIKILTDDNTIPGQRMPKDVEESLPEIMKYCDDAGLTYPEIRIEFLDWNQMAAVCSYGGFPSRYPHWRWGMEYEEFAKGYRFGRHRVYEIVINTIPAVIYCLNSNSYVDNVTVIAHATAHVDFFKNNIFFSPTNHNMMNELANHRSRIQNYQSRWGIDNVSNFLDRVLPLETLIDPAAIWEKKQYKRPVFYDRRDYQFARKLRVDEDHEHMDKWINNEEWMKQEEERIRNEEIAKYIGIIKDPIRNIMGYLKDHAPFQHAWQQDIFAMIYNEGVYFSPQRPTKILNEGWASFKDYDIMSRMALAKHDIFDYGRHKAGVLGGKYSMNPYKLGFNIFMSIEDRWNKGRFGREYDNCKDRAKKESWDTKANLGRQKTFEVRQNYNDIMAIAEFVTPEMIEEHEMFIYQRMPSGDYEIVSKDPDVIKKHLIKTYSNGGLPSIYIEDNNYRNKRILLLQHQWAGLPLKQNWTKDVLSCIYYHWKSPVLLATRSAKDEREMVYVCTSASAENVKLLPREEVEKMF